MSRPYRSTVGNYKDVRQQRYDVAGQARHDNVHALRQQPLEHNQQHESGQQVPQGEEGRHVRPELPTPPYLGRQHDPLRHCGHAQKRQRAGEVPQHLRTNQATETEDGERRPTDQKHERRAHLDCDCTVPSLQPPRRRLRPRRTDWQLIGCPDGPPARDGNLSGPDRFTIARMSDEPKSSASFGPERLADRRDVPGVQGAPRVGQRELARVLLRLPPGRRADRAARSGSEAPAAPEAPTPPEAAPTALPLIGPARRLVENMQASLSVPTASSVRTIPVRPAGGEPHAHESAPCRADRRQGELHPPAGVGDREGAPGNARNALALRRDRRRAPQGDHRARQPRPRGGRAAPRRLPRPRGAQHQARRDPRVRDVLRRVQRADPQGTGRPAHP